MGLFKWIIIIIAVLLVGFILVSSETQEKIIKNSPSILAKFLEKLQNTNENTTTQINNINYQKVGKPMQNISEEINCVIDSDCDNYFSECMNNCKCSSDGYCYKQKI